MNILDMLQKLLNFHYNKQNKQIYQVSIMLSQATNYQQPYQQQTHRQQIIKKTSNLKETFRKYKTNCQEDLKEDDKKIQQLFSGFVYSSIIVGNGDLKMSVRTSITKVQSVQSLQFSSYSELPQLDSFLSISQNANLQHSQIFDNKNQQNLKKPLYIRNFSKLNSVIPNYNHPAFNLQNQTENLLKIIQAGLCALRTVFSNTLKIAQQAKYRVLCVHNECTLNLGFFLHSGWEKTRSIPINEQLQPRENFKHIYGLEQVFQILDQLSSNFVQFSVQVSLTHCLSLGRYNTIRQNLLKIQQKLLCCSNSVYLIAASGQYPQFYYTYLQILRQQNPEKIIKNISKVIQDFKVEWKKKQPVTCSPIGKAVWRKLRQLQIRSSFRKMEQSRFQVHFCRQK